jgi:hypothetical protein
MELGPLTDLTARLGAATVDVAPLFTNEIGE